MGQLPFEQEDREILTRKKSSTSEKYGKTPYDRSAEELINYGLVNVDKPAGPTSHEVSAHVKKILNIEKAGHSGTLDPQVTGVLPTALNRATRIVQSLLTAGKEYVTLMHLHDEVSREEIIEAIEAFQGEIEQMVPVRSAVKRQKRKRNIYYIDVLEIEGRDVLFKAGTQAGTYIRKLCHDIGERLGCGAHMQELRRTKVGPFKEDSLVTLQDVTDAFNIWKEEDDEEPLKRVVQPIENAVEHLPKVWVLDTSVNTLTNGASLKMPGISKLHSGIQEDDPVAVMTLKGELIMVGEAKATSQEMLEEDRGIAVKPNQVFMKPGTYPKI